jgi:hypothetical protein
MTLVLFLFVFFDGGGLLVVVLVLDIAATFEISRI